MKTFHYFIHYRPHPAGASLDVAVFFQTFFLFLLSHPFIMSVIDWAGSFFFASIVLLNFHISSYFFLCRFYFCFIQVSGTSHHLARWRPSWWWCTATILFHYLILMLWCSRRTGHHVMCCWQRQPVILLHHSMWTKWSNSFLGITEKKRKAHKNPIL